MKETLGGIAIVLSLIGYLPYMRDVFRGRTKPHAFSWIVWTLITFVVGIAQLAAGSGWGAIHNLVTGFVCLVILFYAFKNKDKDITAVDLALFVLALVSIPLWVVTNEPTYSIVLLTFIDILAFIPTFRKSWNAPESETLSSYAIAGVKYFIAVAAISSYGFATLLYPIVLIGMNAILVAIIIARNRKCKARTENAAMKDLHRIQKA